MIKQRKLKLKPSQRDKRRYLLISGTSEKVEEAILEYLGVLGMAESAYKFVKRLDGKIVGSVKREMLERVKASLAFKDLSVEKVSGTLKSLGV